MASVFTHIGYDVGSFKDLTADEILKKVRDMSRMDHSSYDSFILYFSGHGDPNIIYGAGGGDDTLKIKEIVRHFEEEDCKTLIEKPKIFLWDCCRGQGSKQLSKGPKETEKTFKMPPNRDVFYGYSTAPEFQAYIGGNATDGLSIWTYYLQKHLRESKSFHLGDLFTIIHHCVKEHIAEHCNLEMTSNY
eukprot:TRINITY_DN2434_c0_g1_i1.p1 TRINITY_DN2434_c0_g1~~TRINITY_DN2434_c0_g1_i1.p1  ORF type:complete len:189 (-),score=38.23 TRINITY_DN2434_c0_g1_i1:93-659(-)